MSEVAFWGASSLPGNVDDRAPVPELMGSLSGKLFGDKGYISQTLRRELLEHGLTLGTSMRKNMKPRLMSLIEKLLLRKRSIIETSNDQLKNISQLEHSCHRSQTNFMVNLVCALIAYTYQDRKPNISINPQYAQAIALISLPLSKTQVNSHL